MAYTNFEVAHAWAHNLDTCHNGSNTSHRYGCFLSYSTCIAQRIEINGSVLYLVNRHSFSSSTSKHQCAVESAIPVDAKKDIFSFDRDRWNRSSFIAQGLDKEEYQRELIRFGLELCLSDFNACLKIPSCSRLNHGVSKHGYDEMVRWFEATGCTTIKKLLRISCKQFDKKAPVSFLQEVDPDAGFMERSAKKFLRFIKAFDEGASIGEVVDRVNGVDTWAKYQQRVSSLTMSQVNRKRSAYLGFATSAASWRYSAPSVRGWYTPGVGGSVTMKDVRKYNKPGEFVKWMLEQKRKNVQQGFLHMEFEKKRRRINEAVKHLERYCGMSGFAYDWHNDTLKSFKYNDTPEGTITRFASFMRERHITETEYTYYTSVSPELQKAWVQNKRNWMLEQLRADVANHEEFLSRIAEEQRLRALRMQEEEARMEKNAAYIESQKALGDEGFRNLWHEGYNVEIYGKGLSFFHGGNVLLRVKNGLVESSKGIKVTIEECKRLWALISRWHKNALDFIVGDEVRATMNNWKIARYEQDILVAGCHAIAYCEMERVAKELNFE